jgi:hypothetical protein
MLTALFTPSLYDHRSLLLSRHFGTFEPSCPLIVSSSCLLFSSLHVFLPTNASTSPLAPLRNSLAVIFIGTTSYTGLRTGHIPHQLHLYCSIHSLSLSLFTIVAYVFFSRTTLKIVCCDLYRYYQFHRFANWFFLVMSLINFIFTALSTLSLSLYNRCLRFLLARHFENRLRDLYRYYQFHRFANWFFLVMSLIIFIYTALSTLSLYNRRLRFFSRTTLKIVFVIFTGITSFTGSRTGSS